MALSDELANLHSHRVVQCPVALLLEALPPDEAEALRSTLARPKNEVSSVDIARVLERHGYTSVNEKKLQTHRRGACACPRRSGE